MTKAKSGTRMAGDRFGLNEHFGSRFVGPIPELSPSQKYQTENKLTHALIRHADNSPQRQYWTDTYDDDGTITWSTSSKKGTKERKQEKKTFRQLGNRTGLNFERVPKKQRSSDIHLRRFYDFDKYFNRKYEGKDWFEQYKTDNNGGVPGGLHHYKYRKGSGDRFSYVEAPRFNTKSGGNHLGKGSQAILSHEIAHALGLRDLSNPGEQAAVKDFSVMGYQTDRGLVTPKNRFSASDIAAIISNYGIKDPKAELKKYHNKGSAGAGLK